MGTRAISDRQLKSIKEALLAQNVYETDNLNNIIIGICWKLRTGAPWRDLPDRFGSWNTIYTQFNRWSKNGIIEKIFKSEIKEPDNEWNCIDGSIVKAHQHSAGARKGEEIAIGKSVAGNSTKIHILSDALGNPLHFEITEGQVHDMKKAETLLNVSNGEKIITDLGYTSSPFTTQVEALGKEHVIPKKKRHQSRSRI